jgi:intracellular septation protein A
MGALSIWHILILAIFVGGMIFLAARVMGRARSPRLDGRQRDARSTQGDSRIRMAWAVFWRVMLLDLGFSALLTLSLSNTTFMTDSRFLVWKPPALWGAFAVLLVLAQAWLPCGLIHVPWGKRLNQTPGFWRKLSNAAAALFAGLAVLSIVIAQLVPFEAWVDLKTAAPLLGLAAFALVVPRRIADDPQKATAADAFT